MTHAAGRGHGDAFLAGPLSQRARNRAAKLEATLRRRLVGGIIGVDQDRNERDRAALENAAVNKTVRMSELARYPSVLRLLAQRRGVELIPHRAHDDMRGQLRGARIDLVT